MAHFTLRSLTLTGFLLLAGCSGLPDMADETAGWSAQKLYTEAKESMGDGAWERAIKMFEKLEARYPYGRYAQQAQLEVAYAYYKSNEQASAVAACERFIKLHPNHPNVDYAYYLKGLAYFNEDLGLLGALANQDLSERDPKAARESFLQVVDFVLANVKSNPNAVFAGSVPYLMLTANLVSGWQMARSLMIAEDKLAAGEDAEFMKAKIATARFYGDHILARVASLRDTILHGGESVTAMPLEAF